MHTPRGVFGDIAYFKGCEGMINPRCSCARVAVVVLCVYRLSVPVLAASAYVLHRQPMVLTGFS